MGWGGGGCLKKQMTKWHLGFSTRSSWLPVEVAWQFVLFLLYLTLLIRYCIIKIENIWHKLTFLYLHTLPMNFLMTPTVHLSQRSIEEASLSLSSIIPQNISDPSPLDSHLSCSSCHFFMFFVSEHCLSSLLLLPVFWTLFSFSGLSLSLSDFPFLFLLLVCPRFCGVVYSPFFHLCNDECCSLYPHPYDEPDGYAERWMMWVKEQSKKRVCLCSSYFTHDTSVHQPWPEGTRH